MMRKTNEAQSPVGILLPSVLAGLLGTLLLMLLGAVLVHRGTLAEGAIGLVHWCSLHSAVRLPHWSLQSAQAKTSFTGRSAQVLRFF